MLTAYLDTNIISTLAKEKEKKEEKVIILEIIRCAKRGEVELHTSDIVHKEIDEIPEEYRYYHSLIYNLIRNVIILTEHYPANLVLGGLGGGSLITRGLGGGRKDPLLVQIEEIIPRPTHEEKAKARDLDVRHLFQYKKNGLAIFWTEDKRTILSKKEDLAKIGIFVMSSEQLMNEISNSRRP